MKKKLAALAAVGVLAFSACGSSEGNTGTTYEDVVVHTDNGPVICVVTDTYHGGGVDCDWDSLHGGNLTQP